MDCAVLPVAVSSAGGDIERSILKGKVIGIASEATTTDILNLDEAAAILRVHPETLRRNAVEWGVPHRRLGSEWRFSRCQLMEWFEDTPVVKKAS